MSSLPVGPATCSSFGMSTGNACVCPTGSLTSRSATPSPRNSNPHSRRKDTMATTTLPDLEGALPESARVVDARARLEEAGVKYVYSCWIDLLGVPKTKPVPISEWEELCAGKGPQFAVHSVSV